MNGSSQLKGSSSFKKWLVRSLISLADWVNRFGSSHVWLPDYIPEFYKTGWVGGEEMVNDIRLDDELGVKNERQ